MIPITCCGIVTQDATQELVFQEGRREALVPGHRQSHLVSLTRCLDSRDWWCWTCTNHKGRLSDWERKPTASDRLTVCWKWNFPGPAEGGVETTTTTTTTTMPTRLHWGTLPKNCGGERVACFGKENVIGCWGEDFGKENVIGLLVAGERNIWEKRHTGSHVLTLISTRVAGKLRSSMAAVFSRSHKRSRDESSRYSSYFSWRSCV